MNRINFLLYAALFLASCGNSSNKTPSENQAGNTTETVAEPEVVPTGDTVNVVLQSDDNMKFDKSEIRVKLGQTVKLTLKHIGTMPKTAMGHNFVLLKKGVDLAEFGNGCATAKAPNRISNTAQRNLSFFMLFSRTLRNDERRSYSRIKTKKSKICIIFSKHLIIIWHIMH